MLVFVIQIGMDVKHRLRLGMGKPYGLGAIHFSEVKVTLINRQERYTTLFRRPGDAHNTWSIGAKTEAETKETLEKAQNAFETWVLSDPEINPGFKRNRLVKLNRIRELLHLLSWPGPNPLNTGYIEVLKVFSERRVLPGPLAIPLQPLTVTAIILDAESSPVACKIQGQDNVFGEIDRSKYTQFNFLNSEPYLCEVLSKRTKRNGDRILTLRPVRGGG